MGGVPPARSGWLSKLVAVAVLAVAVIAGIALSAFFFGFFLVLAVLVSLWVGWQQWRLKRRARQGKARDSGSHEVIQGEYEVVREEHRNSGGKNQHQSHRR